jgi:hypothetical protein
MKRKWFVLSLVLLVLILVACPSGGISLPKISISPEPLPLGPGEQISLTANISPSQTAGYIWRVSPGGGTVSPTNTKTVTYTAPTALGKYTVTVETTDINSVSDSVTIDVVSTAVANDDFDTPVAANQILAAGASKLYKVNVPSGLANELLYFELGSAGDDDDVPNQLIVYDADAKPLAVSTSATSFSAGTSTASSLEAQVTVSDRICIGPCVIVEKETGIYYVKVSSDESLDFNLYVYSDDYEDGGEVDTATENCRTNEDAALQPQQVINPIPIDGAIETLDDVDCFVDSGLMEQVVLATNSLTAIEVIAEVRDATTGVLIETLRAGPGAESVASTSFTPGRQFRVLVSGNDQAGPSKSSKYTVDFQP